MLRNRVSMTALATEKPIPVSVIIPALNAAETIDETLQSLRAQSMCDWEAIVVDDGSTDSTSELACAVAQADARLKFVQRHHGGVAAARNHGIRVTAAPWLLFLDADDLITPDHLAKLTGAAAENPELDLIYGDWARLSPAGNRTTEQRHRETGDLFSLLARVSAFPIHSCIVRRTAVEKAGGFDESFVTCEDWDLWQRIARVGAIFGCVPDVVALYRMRPKSLSTNAGQMLIDGLRVIENGHGTDRRVPRSRPEHFRGLPPRALAVTQFHYLCWCAGLVLGSRGDAVPLLSKLKHKLEPSVDPSVVAAAIFEATLLPACHLRSKWPLLWPGLSASIVRVLDALETRCRARDLARRTQVVLERLISCTTWAGAIGHTNATQVEVSTPIEDVRTPPECERIYINVTVEGVAVGSIGLPVWEGIVPAYVIADAIAGEFAWPILNRFFEATIYPQLRIESFGDATSVSRDGVLLACDLPTDPVALRAAIHDRIDWSLFLQEVWGRTDLPAERFYDDTSSSITSAGPGRLSDSNITVELSEELSDLIGIGDNYVTVKFVVGGHAIGLVQISPTSGTVTAQQLVASLTTAAGFELCRAAVREALIGQSWEPSLSIRQRLRARARLSPRKKGTFYSAGATAVLPRRAPEIYGTSGCRRAVLPAQAWNELDAAAQSAGESTFISPNTTGPIQRIIYAPEEIDRFHAEPCTAATASPVGRSAHEHDRAHFESLFARNPDPWRYTNAYEQQKYNETLSLLTSDKIHDALEIACAEGHFTLQLAECVENLLGVDISEIALGRAAERCRGLAHVRFEQFDLLKDTIRGEYDLVTCSEVLYYMGTREVLENVAHTLEGALKRRGRLIVAHANLLVDEPDRAGFIWDLPFGAKTIGEVLASAGNLRLVHELKTPLYRIQAFERQRRVGWSPCRQRPPKLQHLDQQPAPVPPEISRQVRWHGGSPVRCESISGTLLLPILMYHRIAPSGAAEMTRWRVTPEKFEAQLRYLHDSGFYTPRLHDWRVAAHDRKALPGRAVIFTFDDAYLDFFTHALPLLQQYHFRAIVFPVAERIGKTNTWDKAYCEEIELMDWSHLRTLLAAGFEIGSHSASHPAMTALSPERVVKEAAGSRALLARELQCRIDAFAYPYGDVDQIVKHLVGASGYSFGFTCKAAMAKHSDDLLTLPRFEVSGIDSFAEFIASVQC